MKALSFVAVAVTTISACDGDIQLGPGSSVSDGSSPTADASTDGSASSADGGNAEASTLPVNPFGACTQDADCGVATLHCDTVHDACVECRSGSDCTQSDRRACDSTIGRCVGCLVDADCDSSDKRCEMSIHRCVDRCSADRPCNVGTCELSTGRCTECTPGATCSGSDNARVCTSAAICVECTSDANCASTDDPRCDVLLGRCVRCTSNPQCPSMAVCDPSSGECRSRDSN